MLHQLGKGEGFGKQVDFLKRAERMRFLAIPDDGLLIDMQGKPINAPNPPVPYGQFMYAIDSYGNLFTKDPGVVNKADNVEYFNHSSFNAGKDVISAGMLVIRDGLLLQIDNNSGHYKPTRSNLHEAVRLLEEEGLKLQQATVLVYEFVNNQKQVFAYRAVSFLNSPNGRPDFGMLADQGEIEAFLEGLHRGHG